MLPALASQGCSSKAWVGGFPWLQPGVFFFASPTFFVSETNAQRNRTVLVQSIAQIPASMASESNENGLRTCIYERVIVEWVDLESGHLQTLGSLSPNNKQSAFIFTCALDATGKNVSRMRFSLGIKLYITGKPFTRDIHLDLPLSSPPTLHFEECRIQDVGTVASAAHEAGLSSSGRVLRALLTLDTLSHLIMPDTKSPIRPTSRTGRELLDLFSSLSASPRFTMYLRPSDYAREGLKMVGSLLSRDAAGKSPPEAPNGMPAQDPAPPYEVRPEILVRRSSTPGSPPALTAGEDDVSIVKETPPAGSPASDDLTVEMGMWMAKAVGVNTIAYQDSRIGPFVAEMGYWIYRGERDLFRNARARCSSRFFFLFGVNGDADVHDEVDDDALLQMPAATSYLRDLERLVTWIMRKERIGDVTLWKELMKLGGAARVAVATPIKHDEYNYQKGLCIAWASVVFAPRKERDL